MNDLSIKSKIQTTKRILRETGVNEEKISKMINVYNKIDLNKVNYEKNKNRIFISALTGEGLENLKNVMKDMIN